MAEEHLERQVPAHGRRDRATYGHDAGNHFSKYLATPRPHISLSAEQWKGLLNDDIDIVDGWHK